jgi:protein-tyrosine phosphatase
VSLLTDAEAIELNLTAEASKCRKHGLSFISCPIEDRAVPGDTAAAADLIERLRLEPMAGKVVGIHCRMGIGRSAMIAAALLGTLGTPPEEAFRRIAAARGCEVPDTPEQRSWVVRFLKTR